MGRVKLDIWEGHGSLSIRNGKMPAPTLVVVDMQSGFDSASEPDVVASVAREIIQTKANNGAIIFVEYEGCFPTFKGLLGLTKNYALRSRITKRQDDGSLEVIKCIKRRSFYDKDIRVCGVNADCCVYATVEGLLKKMPQSRVELIKDACGWSCGNRGISWSGYMSHPNLSLI